MQKNFTNDASLNSSEKLRIRFATQADLPQITHIAQITWNDTYSDTIDTENRRDFLKRAYQPEHLADAINGAGHWFYVAQMQERVVGFGHFLRRYHPTKPRAELVRLYVLPNCQSAGIGEALLKTGFATLARAGIQQCFVSVQASNKLAQKFYERYGFTYHRNHGQFLGTQIITLIEYIRPITATDMEPTREPNS